MNRPGNLFVMSSPSGAGKHTIIRRAMAQDPNLVCCVSATSRPPREGEVEGKDYFFLSPQEFLRRRDAGEFLEWAEVHGNMYGILRAEMTRLLESGKDVVFAIDVQGMRHLRELGFDFVSVFVMPPSVEELQARLTARGADTAQEMDARLRNARVEMDAREDFDYVVVNDDLEQAVSDFLSIVQAQRRRASRQDRSNG